MKAIKSLGFAWLTIAAVSAHGQIFSSTIVGYINQVIYQGNNLIANQLADSDNSLNTIFKPGVPAGSTFTEWDAASQKYLPTSVYDSSAGWSINYTLGYGQGGLFNAPATFTNTFVGTVWPGFNGVDPSTPPLVTGHGSQLLSCYIPIGGATFYQVVGRDPQNGDSVAILEAATQVTTVTTYENGAWDNGAPKLDVGEAALFGLGALVSPLNVPEPSVSAMAAIGLLGLATVGRFKKRA